MCREAAKDLARFSPALQRPSDSYILMGQLVGIQQSLNQTIGQLAHWQRHAVSGKHLEADHGLSTLGIVISVTELEATAHHAYNLLETLQRPQRQRRRRLVRFSTHRCRLTAAVPSTGRVADR